MAASSRIAQALVRFWNHPHSRDPVGNYVCSGVFIADKRILTVGHAFDGGATLWAEPRFAGQAYPLIGKPCIHPRHDAACVSIDVMPANAQWLEVDPTTPHALLTSGDCTLDGFWRSGEEHVAIQVLNFAADKGWYITTPKHPRGHSGSALCHAGKVWAIAVEHFADPNTDRGCVLAIEQLWDEWLQNLVAAPVQSGGPRAAVEVKLPLKVSAARSATVAQLRSDVLRLFKRDALQNPSFVEMVDGLPQALADALRQADPAMQGNDALEAVIGSAEALLSRIKGGELTLPMHTRGPVRDALFQAMGLAAKLCLDLDKVPGTDEGATLLVVAAQLPEGATLALRKSPHKCWAWSLSDGIPRLTDRRVERVSIELGEGQPGIDEMNRMAYRSVSVGGNVPAEISSDALMWLRGELNNLRRQGRTHCFIIRSESAAGQELQDWAQRNQACLIVLQPATDATLFLMDEALLLGRIRYFVGLFNDNEWPE